jgi:hypothetical protein
MKRSHMLPAAVLHPILKKDPHAFPTSLQAQAGFETLLLAAETGCTFCTILRDGVLAFAEGDQVDSIKVRQYIEIHANDDLSNLGQLHPLKIEFTTPAGRRTEILFYTDDG